MDGRTEAPSGWRPGRWICSAAAAAAVGGLAASWSSRWVVYVCMYCCEVCTLSLAGAGWLTTPVFVGVLNPVVRAGAGDFVYLSIYPSWTVGGISVRRTAVVESCSFLVSLVHVFWISNQPFNQLTIQPSIRWLVNTYIHTYIAVCVHVRMRYTDDSRPDAAPYCLFIYLFV